MDITEFAARIDHTLLDKDAPRTEYEEVVEEAREYGTNVCLPASRLDLVPDSFEGEAVAVVGFPHGTATPETKAYEARDAVEHGATEVDVACNISHLVSGEDEAFVGDIRAVAEVGVTTKAIVETGLLDNDEKLRAARLAVEAGADYVKTCTGYSEGRATVGDVRLLSEAVGDDACVKASGGVRDAETAVRMLDAGAARIGASSGAEIVRGYSET